MPLTDRRSGATVASAAPAPQVSTPLVSGSRPLGPGAILVSIFLCLLTGHLAIAAYFPSVAVNAIGVIVVVLIIGRVLFIRNDVFAALLIIFFCSQFNFANNQGGLFNLTAFLLFGIYLVAKPPLREVRTADPTITYLLLILVVSNMLGLLLRNPMPPQIVGLEAAAFSGIMLAFYFASQLKLTEVRIRQFLIVTGAMMAYNFVVSLNQHYAILQIDTPLLGLNSEMVSSAVHVLGVFGSASSNGQYAMMLVAVTLPYLAASALQRSLRLWPLFLMMLAIISGLTIILSNMRGSALEAGLIVIIYTFIFSVSHRKAFRNAKYVNMASVAVVVVLITVGVWFNLENLAADFKQVQVRDVSTIESGEALNRLGPWQFGWHRLMNGNWWLGYGQGTERTNQFAWGIHRVGDIRAGGTGHLHNLYLALPMNFGWLGAAAYVLIFFVVFFRLLGAVRRYSLQNIVVVTCLGFLTSIGFFLVDEVKSGNAIQTINFAMVAWIWLGLGLAAWRTVNARMAEERLRKRAAAAQEPAEGDDSTPPESPPARPAWQSRAAGRNGPS